MIVKTSNQKLSAIIRATPNINDFNKRIVFNSLVKRLWNYYPLLWMFCTRTISHEISITHEGEPTAPINDTSSSFRGRQSKQITIYVEIIQKLILHSTNISPGLSALVMEEVTTKESVYITFKLVEKLLCEIQKVTSHD